MFILISLLCKLFQSLAVEIVRSRKTVNRLHENKAQLNSISMHLGESVGKEFIILKLIVLFASIYSITGASAAQ